MLVRIGGGRKVGSGRVDMGGWCELLEESIEVRGVYGWGYSPFPNFKLATQGKHCYEQLQSRTVSQKASRSAGVKGPIP